MTIEASQYINTLDTSLPRATDLLKEGDDHIRLIKANLKKTFPMFTGPVNISSATLNALDAGISATPSGITITGDLGFSANNTLDMNGSSIKRVADPIDENDAATKGFIYDMINALYPVGSLYFTDNGTNPNDMPFFQAVGAKWEPFRQGYTLVSAGNGAGVNLAVGATTGSATHKITTAELPAHYHDKGTLSVSIGYDSHSHSLSDRYTVAGGSDSRKVAGSTGSTAAWTERTINTSTDSHNHTATVGGATGNTGSGTAMSLMQPSVGVYIFKRTA